ncbi:phosphotransferase [Microbacterium lacticum]
MSVAPAGVALTGNTPGPESKYRLAPNRNNQWPSRLQILTYVPPDDAVWETAIPAPASELVCHNDLAPWNLLVGDRWMFIDWDAAAPSTRLWDLAYSAQAFTLSDPSQDPSLAADDLSAFVDGYQPDDHMRRLLPDTVAERTAAMYNMLRASHDAGKEPWASMFTAGHGDHWSSADNYVRTHRNTWLEAL